MLEKLRFPKGLVRRVDLTVKIKVRFKIPPGWGGQLCSWARHLTLPLPLSIQARVVQRPDKVIHRINHYPADSVVCFVSIYLDWIVIYPVDSVNQPLNNWGQEYKWVPANCVGET